MSLDDILLTYAEQLVCNYKRTDFSSGPKAIEDIQGFMKSQETIYLYCDSLEPLIPKIYLKFNNSDKIIGYIDKEDITIRSSHIEDYLVLVGRVIGVKVKQISTDYNNNVIVRCSRKETLLELQEDLK